MPRALLVLALVAWSSVAHAIGGSSQNWSGWSRRNWQPKDAPTTWVLNLNANASQMTLETGSKISTWNDQTGAGNNGTQGTDAQRLIYNATGGPGNLPFVAFDPSAGTNVSFADVFSGLTGAEVFIVRKVGADPPAAGVGAFYHFGTSGADDHVPYVDGNVYDGFGSTSRFSVGNPAASMANWHIWNVTTIAGEYTARVNGVQIFTTGANTVGFFTACKFGRGVGSMSDGGTTTIWLAGGKLNGGDRAAMLSWLNRFWAVGIALP